MFGFGRRATLAERERAETRALWEEVESLWRVCPASIADVHELAADAVQDAIDQTDLWPAMPIRVAACMAAGHLLLEEDFPAMEPDWSIIDNDMEVALNVRRMLARRRRWATDFSRLYGLERRVITAACVTLFKALPPSCFEPWEDGTAFETPLAEVIEDAPQVLDRIFYAPYAIEPFQADLFRLYRKTLGNNIVRASNLPPTVKATQDRLVRPNQNKKLRGLPLAEAYFANTPFIDLLSMPVPFKVPDQTRFEHCHIVGGTGHGKTQLMQRMIYADLVAAENDGRSVVVIDSQGDLISKIVRLALFDPNLSVSLADRLVLIDPADVEFPAALNLFDAHTDRLAGYRPVDQERVLNSVVELYETFFGDLLGAELTQKQGVIFRYLARLMLVIPGATIHTLMQLMEDAKPFLPHMAKLDGAARFFFEKEFFDPSFSATKKQILKRLWGVLSTPAFERMFAQKENKLDLFEALNTGKIVLISTAKDLLKTEGSQLFGRFFIALLKQAALERSTIPADKRTPTFVYVDEAQEYFDDSIETILNQARKYGLSLTLAHQALDQLSPRLRSVLAANTSMKCAGGVSAKDARTLADDLHTTSEFIESMRRKGGRTEFAVWVKQQTEAAIRLSVPLGFLESQTTLTAEDYEALIEGNRTRYCGTLADVQAFRTSARTSSAPDSEVPERPPADETPVPVEVRAESRPARPVVPVAERPLGKGGKNHRYLQSLVKGLAEDQGFKATVEAPLANGAGQVDVLLERAGVSAAFEISVTTIAEHERENVRKCLGAGFDHVALLLTKSARSQGRYRDVVLTGLTDEERARLVFLVPEDVPDYIASLLPPPSSTETVVAGYKVKVAHKAVSPEDARARREALARIVARSLADGESRS